MNIQSFVAEGADYERATALLGELKGQQKGKPIERDCDWLINMMLNPKRPAYRGKTFVEARDASGKLCGVAIYMEEADKFYIDFLCSDCKGTGTQIIEYISTKARAAGKPKLGLSATPYAVPFYISVGFETPPDEDGMYMEKSLVPRPPRPAPIEMPGGRRKAYRRRKSRRHGSTSVRRYKTRRVSSR